jgi:type III pantothenate kinase
VTNVFIDMGNSRIKWALRRGVTLGRQRALDYDDDATAAMAQLVDSLHRVSAVHVVSVAGVQRDRMLTRSLRAAGLPSPQFVQSTPQAAGVRNGYREPWRLGADRWVAAIAGWHEAGRDCAVAVIDIGTATTVDVVDATGQHEGGLIVPGPGLMVNALLRGTRGIAERAAGTAGKRQRGWARDTANALDSGALEATAALVERSARLLRKQHGEDAQVFITGGGAAAVLLRVNAPCRHLADLVLRGLVVLADAQSLTDVTTP